MARRLQCLNCLGFVFYRRARDLVLRRPIRPGQWLYDTDYGRASTAILPLLLISGIAQAWVLSHFGGMTGMIKEYQRSLDNFANTGWIVVLSDSFSIMMFMGLLALPLDKPIRTQWWFIGLILLLLLLARIFFGGLRGSRSDTVFGLFVAAGMVNYTVRRIPLRFVVIAVAFVVSFMYVYGLYENVGPEGIGAALASREQRVMAEGRSHRTLELVLLEECGRSGIQSMLLYRLTTLGMDSDYAWGRTYLGAACTIVPKAIWTDRSPTKVKWGTYAVSGPEYYVGGYTAAAYLYGLAGEAMLNFTPISIPC